MLDRVNDSSGENMEVRPSSVLVVDDNQSILEVVQDVLSLSGFEVRVAHNAKEALEVLSHNTPDLVICDVMMPEMDGFQFYDCMNEHSEWCSIPFLFLTGLSGGDERRFATERGCDDYLTKPFDPMDLVAAVKGKLTVSQRRIAHHNDKMEKFRKNVIQTLSHEFRTPLVSINTGTELLMEQIESLDAKTIKTLLSSIQRGGIRLQRLVEDFMTMQQIDSGAAEMTYKQHKLRVTPSMIVKNAVENFEYTAPSDICDVPIDVVENKDLADQKIEVCSSQIVDSIGRVIANSVKFAGKEKVITVSLLKEEESNRMAFCIRDRGPGLEAEKLMDACMKFSQIDRDKKEQQGAGLGLPIAHYFITLNQGEIDFRKPQYGDGLEVRFYFPLV